MTHLSSGSKSPKIASGSVVVTARFVTQFLLGKELEPMTSVSNGQRFRDNNLEVTYFNDTFMSIRYPKAAYTQLVPWTAVATVIFE